MTTRETLVMDQVLYWQLDALHLWRAYHLNREWRIWSIKKFGELCESKRSKLRHIWKEELLEASNCNLLIWLNQVLKIPIRKLGQDSKFQVDVFQNSIRQDYIKLMKQLIILLPKNYFNENDYRVKSRFVTFLYSSIRYNSINCLLYLINYSSITEKLFYEIDITEKEFSLKIAKYYNRNEMYQFLLNMWKINPLTI